MNWYKMIQGEENLLPLNYCADMIELYGRDWLGAFSNGEKILDWDARSYLKSSDLTHDGSADDILSSAYDITVFSEALRCKLLAEQIGISDLQYLPIRVMQSTGHEIFNFSVANIMTRLPALDRDNTFMLSIDTNIIDPLTGQYDITGIGKAALKLDVLKGHDIIRLTEYWPSIYVSERFVSVFKRNNFTGATFSHCIMI